MEGSSHEQLEDNVQLFHHLLLNGLYAIRDMMEEAAGKQGVGELVRGYKWRTMLSQAPVKLGEQR